MITPKMIEEKTMNESKRKEAKNSIFAFYIGRPISYFLTIPCLYLNIRPNTITYISILWAIMGYFFISFGQEVYTRVLGVIFIFFWNLFDGIDGNIARYKGVKSSKGDMLDTLGGYISMVLIILSMGNAAFSDIKGKIILFPELPIILSGISAVCTLIPRLLMHRKIAMNVGKSNATKLKDKENYGLLKIIMLNICDPAGFQEVIMLLAILFHFSLEFTLIYLVINVIVMSYSIYNLIDSDEDKE